MCSYCGFHPEKSSAIDLSGLKAIVRRKVRDAFPIPIEDERTDSLMAAKIFSSLEVYLGLRQIMIKLKNKNKTSSTLHLDISLIDLVLFGIKNALIRYLAGNQHDLYNN